MFILFHRLDWQDCTWHQIRSKKVDDSGNANEAKVLLNKFSEALKLNECSVNNIETLNY